MKRKSGKELVIWGGKGNFTSRICPSEKIDWERAISLKESGAGVGYFSGKLSL